TAAVDSYKNDPLCRAVRRLVDAGIVVVAAAGNDGKDALHPELYGRIHSPGNEPSAITVGATNTFGTDARSDDAVTTYSSRGPTRSFWTDASGVKHHDNLIKPDLVAPGNKIVSAEAANCQLIKSYPQTVGAPLLITSTPPTPQSTILTQTVTWSQGLVTGQTYATGVDLITKYQKIYGLGVVIGDGVTLSEGVVIGDSTMLSYGVVIGDHVLTANGITMGAGTPFFSSSVLMSDGVIMGDGVLLTDGVIIGDGVLLSDGALMTDGVIMGDYNAVSQAAMANGDDTTCMY